MNTHTQNHTDLPVPLLGVPHGSEAAVFVVVVPPSPQGSSKGDVSAGGAAEPHVSPLGGAAVAGFKTDPLLSTLALHSLG